jgi:hypothetical protein
LALPARAAYDARSSTNVNCRTPESDVRQPWTLVRCQGSSTYIRPRPKSRSPLIALSPSTVSTMPTRSRVRLASVTE